ncbi:hypothetical protein Tco_0715014 [Tanacetum coccineum]
MDNKWQQPITQVIIVLVKNLLIPLAKNTKENAYAFESALKNEMFKDLKYVQSLEKELDELQSDKNEFSNEYDLLLQECLTNIIMCAALSSMTDIDEYSEMACKYLEKIKECEWSVIKTTVNKGSLEPVTPQNLPITQTRKQAKINKNVIKPGVYRLDTMPTQPRTPQLPQTFKNTNPRVSNSTGAIHKTSVSRPQLRINQIKDKVV